MNASELETLVIFFESPTQNMKKSIRLPFLLTFSVPKYQWFSSIDGTVRMIEVIPSVRNTE